MRNLLTITFILSITFSTLSQDCEDVRDYCLAAERDQNNESLFLSESKKQEVIRENFPWGVPVSEKPLQILHQNDFVTGYSQAHRVPLWVAYKMTDQEARGGECRVNCFREDPRLEDGPNLEDYKRSKWDRGHMGPNGDFSFNKEAMLNSFVMSNMTPQAPRFNQCIWVWFEQLVRKWVKEEGVDEIYVVTGSVFDYDRDGKFDPLDFIPTLKGEGRVAIPSHLYKILIIPEDNGFLKVMSILLDNGQVIPSQSQARDYLENSIVRINDIERLTGLDFFPDMQEGRESAIENVKANELWEGVLGGRVFPTCQTPSW